MVEVSLPGGWIKTVVGDYLYLKNGFAFKSNNYVSASACSFPVIRISDLDGQSATDLNAVHVEEGVGGFEVKNGDLLIAMSGATTGKIGVYQGGEPAYQNQRVGNLKLHSEIYGCQQYKNHLISALGDQILKIAYGGAQPNISAKAIEEIEIILPPLAEQKVIADKLDTLLAQVETTKARLERIPDILKTFRQSVLAAAVSGKLTEDWRAENQFPNNVLRDIRDEKESWAKKNPEHNETNRVLKRVNSSLSVVNSKDVRLPEMWSWSQLEDSVLMIVDCHNKTAPYTKEGNPLIRTSNIRDGKFIWDNLRFVSDETYEYWSRRCPPEPGDIIFTREAPMGEAAIIPPKQKLCLGQRTMLIRPVEKYISAKFLLIALMDPNFRKRSEGLAVGTGVKHYRVGDVSNLELAIPSTEEQTQIIHRVEELFAFADSIEQKANAALARVNQLTQSILAKAFRGELTADWRAANPELISGDNSAEALLAKIQAEREALKPAKKTRAKKRA